MMGDKTVQALGLTLPPTLSSAKISAPLFLHDKRTSQTSYGVLGGSGSALKAYPEQPTWNARTKA
jgi:hypothetical protein